MKPLSNSFLEKKTHLDKWVDMSQADKAYEGLRDLFIKEQVIEICPKDLSTYLQERTPRNLDEMAKIGEKYLEACGRKLHQVGKTDVYNKKTPYREQANCHGCVNSAMIVSFLHSLSLSFDILYYTLQRFC